MQNWIYFVLIAQGIWSITSFIDKIVISKGYIKNPAVYIVLNGSMNILLIFLLPFVGVETLNFTDFLIALISGITFSIAVAIYYKAVQYDEISRVVMLNQISPIFVLILAFLFLKEELTKNHFIGFLFLIGAGVIMSYKRIGNSFKLSKAFYYMLVSAFIGAISAVAAKHIFSVANFWTAFVWLRLMGFTALSVLLLPSIRHDFIQTFKNMKNNIRVLLGFKMIIDFSAFIFASYALLKGNVSLVTALSTAVQPLLVFVFALLISIYLPKIVKEKIDKRAILTKLFAIVLIIVGIVFVNK